MKKEKPIKKEKITEKEAKELLKKYSVDKKGFDMVLEHSQAVKNIALIIAKEIKKRKHPVDLNLIKIGSLLHDIGRFKYPPWDKKMIRHGYWGGQILRKEGLLKEAKIAERHLGAGISKEEIIKGKLFLPKKDFLPKTIEEKVIAYVDNLIFQDRLGEILEVADKFKGLPVSVKKRLVQLHNEIEKLRGGVEKF